jgi:hypothetical protein
VWGGGSFFSSILIVFNLCVGEETSLLQSRSESLKKKNLWGLQAVNPQVIFSQRFLDYAVQRISYASVQKHTLVLVQMIPKNSVESQN